MRGKEGCEKEAGEDEQEKKRVGGIALGNTKEMITTRDVVWDVLSLNVTVHAYHLAFLTGKILIIILNITLLSNFFQSL